MLRNNILPLAAATTICLGALGAHANPPTYANPQLRTTAVQLRDAVEHQRALGWFDATTPIRVVDVRSAKAFAAGHLPGAINLPTNELADPMAHVPGALKSDRRIAQLLGLLGINARTAVVIYDDKGGFHAARLFWLLEYYGHRKVSLLDGGIQAWKAAGFRLIGSRSQAPHRKAVFAINRMPRRFASADWILDRQADANTVVVDVRPGKAFAKGHIPWAKNIPWKQNLNRDGTIKSASELIAHFNAKGVTKDKNIVVHCQTGEASSHSYYALRLLGYPRVRTYHRSWAEWGSADDLPKATAGHG